MRKKVPTCASAYSLVGLTAGRCLRAGNLSGLHPSWYSQEPYFPCAPRSPDDHRSPETPAWVPPVLLPTSLSKASSECSLLRGWRHASKIPSDLPSTVGGWRSRASGARACSVRPQIRRTAPRSQTLVQPGSHCAGRLRELRQDLYAPATPNLLAPSKRLSDPGVRPASQYVPDAPHGL